MTTFRNRRNRSRRRRWHLIRITDTQGAPQFAVGLDPSQKTIEFSILRYDRSLQTLTWQRPEVFTDEWHKIHFGVFRDRVVLYVNCNPVGEKPMEYVDSRIDLNGEILIAKEAGGFNARSTVPIDLQWMVMTCDPESVERETCDELPVILVLYYNRLCKSKLLNHFIASGEASRAAMSTNLSGRATWA